MWPDNSGYGGWFQPQYLMPYGQLASRQYGGWLNPGQPSLVGESGPEMFVPDLPGTIVPLPQPRQPQLTDPMLPVPSDEAIRHWTNPAFRTHALPWDLEFWQSQQNPPIPDLVDEGVLRFHPEAWNEWLLRQPRSKRIEDRRFEVPPSIEEGDPVATNQPSHRRR
jgi:hypothetical protein